MATKYLNDPFAANTSQASASAEVSYLNDPYSGASSTSDAASIARHVELSGLSKRKAEQEAAAKQKADEAVVEAKRVEDNKLSNRVINAIKSGLDGVNFDPIAVEQVKAAQHQDSVTDGMDGQAVAPNRSPEARAALAGLLPTVAAEDAANRADRSLGGTPVRQGVVAERANRVANLPADLQQAAYAQDGVQGQINRAAGAMGNQNVIAPVVKESLAATDNALQASADPAADALRTSMYDGVVDQVTDETFAQKDRRERGVKDMQGVARYGYDFAAGDVGSVGSTLAYLGRKTGVGAVQELGDSMANWAADKMPANPTTADTIVNAFGSAGSFYIPGLGVQKATTAMSMLPVILTKWAGAGTMAGMEAAAEADGVYKTLKHQGVSEEEAAAKADTSFMANMALLGVTDKFAFFNDIKAFDMAAKKVNWKGVAAKGVAGAAIEGPQESGQQFISNYLTGRPITEGAVEAGLIGALVGGGMVGAHTAYDADQKINSQAAQTMRSINNILASGQHQQLSDANLAHLHQTAQAVDQVSPGSVGVSQIEAEVQRRANLGTLERAAEEAARAGSPLNQNDQPTGTLSQAAANAPAQPQEEPAVPMSDVTHEHIPAMDDLALNHWALNSHAEDVIKTLGAIQDDQTRIDTVNRMGLSPKATAQLHEDLGHNEVKPATFQDVHHAEVDGFEMPTMEDLVLPESKTPDASAASAPSGVQSQAANLPVNSDPDLAIIQDGVHNDIINRTNQDIAATNAERAKQGLEPIGLATSLEHTGDAGFSLQDAPESAVSIPAAKRLGIELIAKAFGKKVRYIQDANGRELFFHGVYGGSIGADENTIFLDAKGDHSLTRVVGHEIAHALRTQAPDLYSALEAELTPLMDSKAAQAQLEGRGYATKDALASTWGSDGSSYKEESIADMVGDKMTEPKFWLDVAKKMTAAKAQDFFSRSLAVLTKALKTTNSAPLSSQDKAVMRKAHSAIVTAMAEYKQRIDKGEIKGATETEGEAKFAKKDEEKFSVLKREKASGRYVGAPDWVGSSTAEVAKLYKKVKGMAVEGESGKLWYEKSSKAVLDLVGGDKAEAEKFVGLLAIYSQGTEVGVNTGFALEAYYQWKAGLPIKTGRFPTEQTKKANMWLKEGKDWGGIKTNNFYVDLMEEINPASVDESHATMDMWMALAFDYGMKVLDQGPKYAFAKTMTELIAKDMSWKPHQVQAAVWSSIKTRIEATEKERVAKERKNGIQTQNEDGTWSYTKGREYDHFRLAHALGMKLEITPEEIAAKGFNYEDALNQRMIQMSWEATPSVTAGTIPGIHKASLNEKMEYLTAVSKALTEDGKNLIAEAVGLHSPPTMFGVSAWEGQTGAGAQSFLPAPILGTKGKRAVLPVARNLLNDYSALMGLVLKQDAVVWHHAVFDESNSRKNGMDLITNRALTEAEVADIYLRVYNKFGTWEIAPGYTANGVKLLNFVEGLANKDFQKGIEEIIEDLPDSFGGGFVEHRGFRSDGEYIGNNWKENKNGEEYQERLRARRPDLLERATDLRARVEAVDREFDKKYGWGPSFSRKDSASAAANGRAGDGSAERVAQQERGVATQLRGVHYSSQQRQNLDGRFYGTGIKGAEESRLAQAKDRRIRTRLYFYIDEGNGIKPEAGVGKFAHNVDLTNLYDTSTRTLTWAKDPYGDNAVTANNFESAVLDAGYSGYYRPAAFGTQGVAILLGDAAVNVKPVEVPQFSRKQVSQLVMINEVAGAKATWGRHIGADQIRVAKAEGETKEIGLALNSAYIEAAKQKDAFDEYIKSIAELTGTEAKIPGLKGRKRTVEKVVADYNGNVSMMKDMLRATLATDSITEARQLYELLSTQAKIADVSGALKNTLETGSSAGYRDAKIILDINGVPAELIIAPKALLAAKEIAHALYENRSTLARSSISAKTKAEANRINAAVAALDAKMVEIYLPAYERAQSSSASLRVQGTEFSRELKVLSGRLSGSNANLGAITLPSGSTGSATGMPSKSKNLVPSGKSANGDVMSSSSKDSSIPQGKDIKLSRKQFEPSNHEAFDAALTKASKATTANDHAALIPVSNTPAALKQVKALRANSLVVGTGATIYLKGINQHSSSAHNAAIPLEVLRKLPQLLADPLAIYDKGAFDKANPKAKNSTTEKLYLVVLPVKVGGEYVTLAITPDAKFGKSTANFVKSVHTRAPKTLNLYSKHMVYEGITQRKEAPTSPEQFLDREPRGSQIEVAEAPFSGTDLTIRPPKGIDKVKSRNDVPSFARKTPAQNGSLYALPEETFGEAKIREFQNDQLRWKQQLEAIRDRGGVVDDQNDVYQAMERMSARAMNSTEDFYRSQVTPLLKQMHDDKITLEDVGNYLYAMHAGERNAHMRQINPTYANAGPDDQAGSGMTDNEAKKIIAETRARADFAKIEAAAKTFRGWAEANLNNLVQGGLITPQQAADMRKTYQNYVPLKGYEDMSEKGGPLGQGSGFSTAKRVIKRALGRGSKAGNPAVYIIHGVAEGMMAREKANVGRYLERLILANPDDKLWTINMPEKERVMGSPPTRYEVTFNGQNAGTFQSKKQAEQYVKLMNLKGATITATGGADQVTERDLGFDADKEVRFIRDGKEVRIQLKDPLLARSYNNRGASELGDFLKATTTVNAFLRTMWTQKNPVFPFVNVVRDVPSAMLYATGEHGAGYAGKVLKDIPGAFKAMWQMSKGKPVTNGMDVWVKEYRKAGGNIGFRMISDIESSMDKINRIQKNLGEKTVMSALSKGQIFEAGKRLVWKSYNNSWVEYIEHANVAFENMTRLAVYKAAREKGLSISEASRLAKNATVNFNRKGEKSSSLNALYLFSNAATQDVAKSYQSVMKSQHKGQVRAALAGVMVLGFMLAALGGDDDDLDSENMNVTSLRFSLGDAKINIPLPYGPIGFLYYLGRSAALVAQKGESGMLQSLRLASALISHVSPINPIPNPDNPDFKNFVVGLTPTALEMFTQVATNRNSFGNMLAPDYNEKDPDAYKSFRGTRGSVYADLAAWMNESTGGTTREAGLVDVSPETLKGILHYLFGGTGKFVADTASVGSDLATKGGTTSNKIPLVNRFYKKEDVTTYRTRFYDQAGEAKGKLELLNKYQKDRNVEKVKELLPWRQLGVRGNHLWDKMNQLRDQELQVSRDGTLSTSAKEGKLKQLEEQQIELSNTYHKLFKEKVPK